MPSTHRFTVWGTVAALLAVSGSGAEGQGVISATVSGTVASSGRPVVGALVTLSSLNAGDAYQTTSARDGSFIFALVGPGTYEIRAEAIGYRPLLARTLTLTGGEAASVSLDLTASPPPVIAVDTVSLPAGSSSRWRGGGVRLGAPDLDELPYRFGDVSSVAALSSFMDSSLGADGLPGSTTMLVADGVPVYRAPHPLALAEQLGDPLFPASALSGITVYRNAPDIEWAGSAGGYLALATRSGTRNGGVELDGAWSGAPLWSSSKLDVSKPSLHSFQGGLRETIPIDPGRSSIVVSGEGLQQETPMGPRVPEELGTGLGSLDPSLIESLTGPGKERLSRVSGLARFDSHGGMDSRLFVRGAAAYSKREFDGPGPISLARDVALPEKSVDYSVAAGYIRAYRPRLVLEVRGGISGSDRTFSTADAVPAAVLVGSGYSLGVVPGGAGESSRTDVVAVPTLRYGLGPGTLKVGASARSSDQTMSHEFPGYFFYSDTSAVAAGQGFVHAESSQKVSFTTREYGGFAQYEMEVAPGLRLSAGGRFDYEKIPSGVVLNGAWLQASGLSNDSLPSALNQIGAAASLVWEPSRSAGTTFFSTFSLHHGDLDPRLVFELFARDDAATSTRFAGSGLDWPASALPPGATPLPTLTLFGPDVRAPRSEDGSAGIVQRLIGGWNGYLGAAYRRTDFLMRRRDLNRPTVPIAVDAFGRDVYGTLTQDGSLVTATGTDSRRLAGFDEAWALDPDGWSKYRGVTAGLEYEGRASRLYVSYTLSETTDNWIGAARAERGAAEPPALPSGDDWTKGTSDFDVRHRVSATATTSISFATLSATYRFRSGLPFTPGYRPGVDANGDRSYSNDVAYVDAALVDPLLSDWPCLSDQVGGFAVRNSCRGPVVHSVDARLRLDLGAFLGREASLVLDAFNLVESKDGIRDNALLLVDPTASLSVSPDGSTVTVPVTVNPDFGKVVYPSTRGRMLRIGFKIW